MEALDHFLINSNLFTYISKSQQVPHYTTNDSEKLPPKKK